MARRGKQPPPEPLPVYLAMPREDAAGRIARQIQSGQELRDHSAITFDAHDRLRLDYYTWGEYNEEMLRRMFTGPGIAEEYRQSTFSFGSAGGPRHLDRENERLNQDIGTSIRVLESIRQRLELIPLAPGAAGDLETPKRRGPSDMNSTKVFIVHGHDEGARESVARLLSLLGLTPIILHEQASGGRTVVEKLEHHGDVGFAIVLLTPDDVGGVNEEALKSRARQNVVLELGYFMGRLRRARACALHRGDIELPSDYLGVVYLPLDSGAAWRLQLAKELKDAGFPVDMNKL